MGVTLDLRLIDHQRIAVHGLRAVNDAIRHQDPEILREYLTSLPVEIDPSVVDLYSQRLSKLRELNSPEIILQNEERSLRLANGEAYQTDQFKNSTLDELRQLLGTWCWRTNSYGLDKASHELHWFLEPMAGPDQYPLYPVYPRPGSRKQSVITRAFYGATDYPKDDLDQPVIRTCGSQQPGCFGYNPPRTCTVILEVLQRVKQLTWKEHVPLRCELYQRQWPEMTKKDITSRVKIDLSFAKEAFPVLLSAYSKAVEKKYGVSCEYSL